MPRHIAFRPFVLPLPALVLVPLLAGCLGTPVGFDGHATEVTAAAGPGGTVHRAVPPACGPVPTTVGTAGAYAWHDPGLGIGCASARNLGVLAADPRDLVRGRELAPAVGEREGLAVQRYLRGRERPLVREMTREGTAEPTGGGGGEGGGQ